PVLQGVQRKKEGMSSPFFWPAGGDALPYTGGPFCPSGVCLRLSKGPAVRKPASGRTQLWKKVCFLKKAHGFLIRYSQNSVILIRK
ncbi:MAG TPA: hypothetical protein PLU82_08045, partial [Oscillospiraceae bacterium]|nr:hypothetical protein [Oscillospiraceae bacterium]